MNFNQAIPLQLRPKFSEGSALASERDSRSNAQSWKKARSISRQENSNGIAIQKLTREVGKMRRRIVGASMPFEDKYPPFHPFRLYNVPSEECPPKDPANDYDPAVDSWRTFRVRFGLLGYRSKWQLPVNYYGGQGYKIPDGTDGDVGEKWFREYEKYEFSEKDFLVTNEVVYVGNVGDFGAIDGNNATFVLPKTPPPMGLDDIQGYEASFWIEFTDATQPDDHVDVPKAKIKCRMTTADVADSTGRTTIPFPQYPNFIIPVGMVMPKGGVYYPTSSGDGEGAELIILQYLYDHVLNRYSQGQQGGAGGTDGVMAYRGDWDSDSLENQVFYPGDMTKKQKSVGTFPSSFFVDEMFIHVGVGVESSAPVGDGSPNWIRVSGYYI